MSSRTGKETNMDIKTFEKGGTWIVVLPSEDRNGIYASKGGFHGNLVFFFKFSMSGKKRARFACYNLDTHALVYGKLGRYPELSIEKLKTLAERLRDE